jgi:hypothetical protein
LQRLGQDLQQQQQQQQQQQGTRCAYMTVN